MSTSISEKTAKKTIEKLRQRSRDVVVDVILKGTPKTAGELEPEVHAVYQGALDGVPTFIKELSKTDKEPTYDILE